MNFNRQVKKYANILNQSFKIIYDFTKTNERDLIEADQVENGYLQFIWEMVVESELRKNSDYLEPYGDGADFYGTSSRAIYPEKNATKKLVIHVKNKIDLISNKIVIDKKFDFIKLIHFDGQFYYQKSPFDSVLCDNEIGNKSIFRLNEVDFILENIEE